MSLLEVARRAFSDQEKFITKDELAELYPEGVILNGYAIADLNGKQVPKFFVQNEERLSFLASGLHFEKLAAELLEAYKTAEEVDAALKREPLMVKIYPKVRTKNQNIYQQVELLGVVDLASGEVRRK